LLVCVTASLLIGVPRRYSAKGLVIGVDSPNLTVTISHAAIAGYMDAMVMPFHVREVSLLRQLHAGDNVTFTLAVDTASSWVEEIRTVPFQSAERDPALASRLRLLDSAMGKSPAVTLANGEEVPDFTLTDQTNRQVTLSKLRGKVVAMNFVYTRCPLPDYCFRLSNNFGRLEERLRGNRDLVLLTVTFDPVHDRPEILARYAQTWRADPAMWHFLTGDTADVERVCGLFGVAHWRDDGLFTHSLRTVVIDRQGRVAANIEGNTFSARQLGDLVEAILRKR